MIQIDIPMPKNCLDCPACNEYLMCAIPCNGRGWGENDVKDFSQSRPEWCPMKEQEKLVDVDALREKLGLAKDCAKCKQNTRACQYDSHFSLMDFCERFDIAIEELMQEGL